MTGTGLFEANIPAGDSVKLQQQVSSNGPAGVRFHKLLITADAVGQVTVTDANGTVRTFNVREGFNKTSINMLFVAGDLTIAAVTANVSVFINYSIRG